MPPSAGPDPFASTEQHYAQHRPDYSDAAIQHVVERFGIDAGSRVLDLGCGTGELAVPLARRCGRVIGMDPNERMIHHARLRSDQAGLENARWLVGSDADLREELGPLDLTVMGRSFHWMNQERTLDRLLDLTNPGGGLAIFGDVEWVTHGVRDWQAAVYDIAERYVDDLPERVPAPEIEYEDPWDELIADFGFVEVEKRTFDSEREWTTEEVIGYVFSLSFCAPDVLGADRRAFAGALRARLDEFNRETFVETVEETVITGRKPPAGHTVP